MIQITDKPIDVGAVIQSVRSDDCGAVDVFIGSVRDSTQGKSVTRLEFEAYDVMAIKELEKIVAAAHEQWPIKKYAVVHRKGILQIGEDAVVIAVSSPHRVASFAACKYIIDTLKQTVPIWKKEIFEDGEEWVAAHP